MTVKVLRDPVVGDRWQADPKGEHLVEVLIRVKGVGLVVRHQRLPGQDWSKGNHEGGPGACRDEEAHRLQQGDQAIRKAPVEVIDTDHPSLATRLLKQGIDQLGKAQPLAAGAPATGVQQGQHQGTEQVWGPILPGVDPQPVHLGLLSRCDQARKHVRLSPPPASLKADHRAGRKLADSPRQALRDLAVPQRILGQCEPRFNCTCRGKTRHAPPPMLSKNTASSHGDQQPSKIHQTQVDVVF